MLNSGNYTATVKGNFQGYSATVNIYKNGGTAYNISTVYHSVPVSYRYFYSDGSVYIIVPSVLSYAVVDETDPVIKKLENIASQATALLTNNEMTCLGVSSGAPLGVGLVIILGINISFLGNLTLPYFMKI